MSSETARRSQTTAALGQGLLRLRGSSTPQGVLSPYFQRSSLQKIGTTQGYSFILVTMKAITALDYALGTPTSGIGTAFYNGSTLVTALNIPFDLQDCASTADVIANAESAINTYALSNSYTLSEGIIWVAGGVSAPVESALSLTLQTSTGAVGTQVSATKGAWVTVTGSVTTTASISGNSSGNIFVEVAPTNSATAGDWVEKGRVGNSQALSLAVALQSVQTTSGTVSTYLPAGYYLKARTAGSGTVSYTLNEARQVI